LLPTIPCTPVCCAQQQPNSPDHFIGSPTDIYVDSNTFFSNYCEEVGSWEGYDNNHNNKSWGREGDFAVHTSVYGKVQVGAHADVRRPKEKKKKKKKKRRLSFLSCPSWAV
jgi:hypothetical protein